MLARPIAVGMSAIVVFVTVKMRLRWNYPEQGQNQNHSFHHSLLLFSPWRRRIRRRLIALVEPCQILSVIGIIWIGRYESLIAIADDGVGVCGEGGGHGQSSALA